MRVTKGKGQGSVLPVRRGTTTVGAKSGGGRDLRGFDAAWLRGDGVRCLAGVDEAGRGALAGPVVAAAVVVGPNTVIEGIDDSKVLSPARREALCPLVCAEAEAVAVGWATAEEVDRLNVLEATLLAAGRALEMLEVRPDVVLTDYLKIRGLQQPVEPLAKGDARSQAIAAASVVAKVMRDRWMRYLDQEYPEYGFAAHKGYGVKAHLAALQEAGSSSIHRHSFRGVCWFDHEPKVSATLERLLEEVARSDIAPDEGADTWLGSGYMLPESEEASFREALRLKWLDEAASAADRTRGKVQ